MLFFSLVVLSFTVFGTQSTNCPIRYPYAYFNGRYCCQFKKEKIVFEHRDNPDNRCDGSGLSSKSECCLDNKFVRCPFSTCTDNHEIRNGKNRCPPGFPYPYFFGMYCCKWKREKQAFMYRMQDETCDGSNLKIGSMCCEEDAFKRCPTFPCIKRSNNQK